MVAGGWVVPLSGQIGPVGQGLVLPSELCETELSEGAIKVTSFCISKVDKRQHVPVVVARFHFSGYDC